MFLLKTRASYVEVRNVNRTLFRRQAPQAGGVTSRALLDVLGINTAATGDYIVRAADVDQLGTALECMHNVDLRHAGAEDELKQLLQTIRDTAPVVERLR